MPKISVVMAVYNSERYLREAIDSVLSQTYQDFEFIIIDDGSTDQTEKIVANYQDPRLLYFKRHHAGLVSSLNFGLSKARGEFIARFDADDICELDRLEKQRNFLETNPEIMLIGSHASLIDEAGSPIGKLADLPGSWAEIKKYSWQHNPFIHSSVMFRSSLLAEVGNYNRRYKHIEDYELWTRIIYRHPCANLPLSLVKYRRHSRQITKHNTLSIRLKGLIVRFLAIWRLMNQTGIFRRLRLLSDHPGVKKYLHNFSWAFAGRSFSLAVSFFVGALVARYLGPERYGVLNYAISFVTIFSFLSAFGIDNILTRELIKHRRKNQLIIDTAFALKAIAGLAVFALIFLVSFFLLNRGDGYMNVLIMIYALQMIISAFNVTDSYFQSIAKNKYIFIGQTVSTVAVSALKLVLVYRGFGTGWFIGALIFEALVYVAMSVSILRRLGYRLHLKIDKTLAKEMLSDSWPFILSSAFFLIYSRIDQVMIGQMIDSHSLGLYSAGVKPAEVWYFIPSLLCTSLFPALMNSKITDERSYHERTKKIFYLVSTISIFIAFFESLFARDIILFLFGQDYSGAIATLRIYTWAGVPISILTILNQYLTIENRARTIMISSFVGAGLNIWLNLWFIPLWGIAGSACATLISYSAIPAIIWTLEGIKNRK